MKLLCDFYENPSKKVAVGLNGLRDSGVVKVQRYHTSADRL
jgi:hypothetical protein